MIIALAALIHLGTFGGVHFCIDDIGKISQCAPAPSDCDKWHKASDSLVDDMLGQKNRARVLQLLALRDEVNERAKKCDDDEINKIINHGVSYPWIENGTLTLTPNGAK